jgi:hypothetical protein
MLTREGMGRTAEKAEIEGNTTTGILLDNDLR